jgi:hypothetical protein
MFNVIAEQFAALHKANLDQATKAAGFAFSHFEHALAWNLTAAKQMSNTMIADAKTVANIKTVDGVASLAGMNEGKAEQLASFGREAYDQMTRTQAETVKFVEGAAAEYNTALVKFVDGVSKAAPVGGDALAQSFKQVFAAQQSAAEQTSNTLKQAFSFAEAQVKAAAEKTTNVVKMKAGRK